MKFESVLETVIRNALDVEDYDLDSVSSWVRRQDLPAPSREKRDALKMELGRALKEPSTVTPELFERWTRVDLETQEEVQERLQELWNVCFGETEPPK
ncbi:hypothetical protein [Verrucomicrobium spinosum]|uniref:hypothetical protein n=1 Tax=Verrucomicrobium spinosum TaxID=2736 RepID=UPI0001744467|nr:hypothetical protein [Verrucomicrobium spinosum]